MATAVQQHERECAVCTNDFKTPKILPCGHLLCLECVIYWIKSKSDAGCPLCTCPIVEHQGNSSPSAADVAEALPTDSVMEAIVESSGTLVRDNMCTVCDEVTAEYICMQCGEKMCPSCMKTHKKMIATRSHDVESVSTVTPERLAASRPALCADHGDKHAELFCPGHNLVICGTCFSNKHKECSSVKHLDNEMQSAEKSLDSLKEKLAEGEDNLKQAIVNLNVRMQQADVTEQENMALVDKTCDRLQKMVDECRKQLKKLISDSFSTFKKSLCDVKSELDKRLGKVTSHKHLVTRATTIRPRPALIHAAQTLTDRVNSLDLSSDMKADAWVNPSPEITLHCDDVVKQITAELQNMELQLAEFEAPVLVFHENCGSGIMLMNGQKTARRTDGKVTCNSDCVVLSRDAMAVNVLYEVRIDEMGERKCIYPGVTGTPPAQYNFTTWIFEVKDLIIIWDSGVYCKGALVDSDIGNALNSITVGSRVGVLVDSSKDLHLYVDGQDQGVADEDVPWPCFAVFELGVSQVTALKTSRKT